MLNCLPYDHAMEWADLIVFFQILTTNTKSVNLHLTVIIAGLLRIVVEFDILMIHT
jgi:hypothetical protein